MLPVAMCNSLSCLKWGFIVWWCYRLCSIGWQWYDVHDLVAMSTVQTIQHVMYVLYFWLSRKFFEKNVVYLLYFNDVFIVRLSCDVAEIYHFGVVGLCYGVCRRNVTVFLVSYSSAVAWTIKQALLKAATRYYRKCSVLFSCTVLYTEV